MKSPDQLANLSLRVLVRRRPMQAARVSVVLRRAHTRIDFERERERDAQ